MHCLQAMMVYAPSKPLLFHFPHPLDFHLNLIQTLRKVTGSYLSKSCKLMPQSDQEYHWIIILPDICRIQNFFWKSGQLNFLVAYYCTPNCQCLNPFATYREQCDCWYFSWPFPQFTNPRKRQWTGGTSNIGLSASHLDMERKKEFRWKHRKRCLNCNEKSRNEPESGKLWFQGDGIAETLNDSLCHRLKQQGVAAKR